MSVQDSNYLLTSICPAAPGWRGCWYEASSTANLTMHAEPIAVWGIARFTEDEYEFTETVGICPNGNTMEPLEAADGGGFIGYLAPGEDVEKYRGDALRRLK